MGSYEKSIEDFNVVIRLNPTTSRPLYNRGLTYLRRGDKSRALLDYDAALALNPKDADALAGRQAIIALNVPLKVDPTPAPSINAVPIKEAKQNAALSEIVDPGCSALKQIRELLLADPYSRTWKDVYGKSLEDWQTSDIAKLRSIFESCRMQVPTLSNYSARTWPKVINDYIEGVSRIVEQANGQKAAQPAGIAILAEARALSPKVANKTITDAEVARLRQIVKDAAELVKINITKGYHNLQEAADARNIAESALATFGSQQIIKQADEEHRKREVAEQVAAEVSEKLEAQRSQKKKEEAAKAGYAFLSIADVVLDKQNLKGKKIAVEGFLTVRENAAILDFPTVGEVGIDLSNLPLDVRKYLLARCYAEQARCFVEMRGIVANISTSLTNGPGLIAEGWRATN